MGKGLDRLFQDSLLRDRAESEETQESVMEINIKDLLSNPYQPRQHFEEEAIEELAASIKEHGIIQPIIVRKCIKGYQIVAGERRMKAAKEAGLQKVPVIVKDFTDKEMMELALIENLQREDLNPIEIALAYQRLIEEFGYTQQELAKRLGISRPLVTNSLRLLELPGDLQEDVSRGTLSKGHAIVLLGVKDSQLQRKIAKRVKEEALSVRQLEVLVQELNEKRKVSSAKKKTANPPIFKRYEDMLQEVLSAPVKIKQGRKKGKIEIEYYSERELERLIEMMHGNSLISH